MKKKYFSAAVIAALTLTSCNGLNTMGSGNGGSTTGNILGSILGAAANGETISNILTSVIGLDKLSSANLLGTWHYKGPGCAFTSENALAKAGGEVAATEVEQKLLAQYKKLGFNSQNTFITFNRDGTFTAQIDGKPWKGHYTFDEKTQSINFKGLLLNFKGYAKREANGISILFESRKALSLLQTISAISGNSTLETIGKISKNYDGVRIGFDMRP